MVTMVAFALFAPRSRSRKVHHQMPDEDCAVGAALPHIPATSLEAPARALPAFPDCPLIRGLSSQQGGLNSVLQIRKEKWAREIAWVNPKQKILSLDPDPM